MAKEEKKPEIVVKKEEKKPEPVVPGIKVGKKNKYGQ